MNAQEITNFLTAAVAIATVWLGFETRKMAAIAKESIALESCAYLSFRGFYIKIGDIINSDTSLTGALRLGLRLCNPGKVLVRYHVELFNISQFNSKLESPTFDTSDGVIHPSEETLFFYPVIVASQNNITPPTAFEVDYQISYWTIPSDKKTLRAKINLNLIGGVDHEWVYIDGPNYS
jgi:hypothetical protein